MKRTTDFTDDTDKKEKAEEASRWFISVKKTHRWTEFEPSVEPFSVSSVKSVVPNCIRLEAGMAYSLGIAVCKLNTPDAAPSVYHRGPSVYHGGPSV